MTLSKLCKEVLELDAKATKGPWPIMNTYVRDLLKIQILACDEELIAHYRTAAVKLAKAAQRMEAALDGLKRFEVHVRSVGSIYSPSLRSDQIIHENNYRGFPAIEALSDVQKIVEGK